MVLDGTPYAVSHEIAEFFAALVEADGLSVSAASFGVRSRDTKQLPKAFRDVLDASPGGGTAPQSDLAQPHFGL